MKTTDGFEIKKNSYYFTEKGESVILNSCATTDDGKDVFLVTPMYEGEAMSCNCDGGFHSEVTIDYEHEGEETLVSSIFKIAPTVRLDTEYNGKMKEIEQLSLSLGSLIETIKANKSELSAIKNESIAASKHRDIESRRYENSKLELEKINEEISEKRQTLSELEDSISDLKSEDVSSLISKTELQRLNKRDFKLQCIENGGVDNWEWYSESLKDYNERYPED